MTFGIEVGCIVFALEVAFAEGDVANLDDAVFIVVHQDRDMVLLAGLLYNFADRSEAGAIDIPRSDVANLGFGAMLFNTTQKNF